MKKEDLMSLFPKGSNIRLNQTKSYSQAFVDCPAMNFEEFIKLKKSIDGTIVY